MRLIDLHPQFYGAGGDAITDKHGNPVPERHGLGVTFDCPCGCEHPIAIPFVNPLDGGPKHGDDPRRGWQRTGDSFETLTLSPSILRMDGCGWHGWVTEGEIIKC
jgi:hypothetical protein